MTINDLLRNALTFCRDGKPYRVKSDNPKQLQNNIHKALKRRRWKGWKVYAYEDRVEIYTKA